MLQPLYAMVFGEVALILVLLFRTPLRKPLLVLLDRVKQGRGPVVASTAGATLIAVLVSLLYNIASIKGRSEEGGAIDPTDQVILAYQLLQTSLIGFSLLLGLMIDRIHYYIKDVGMLTKHLEALTKMDRKSENVKGYKEAVVEEEEEDDLVQSTLTQCGNQ